MYVLCMCIKCLFNKNERDKRTGNCFLDNKLSSLVHSFFASHFVDFRYFFWCSTLSAEGLLFFVVVVVVFSPFCLDCFKELEHNVMMVCIVNGKTCILCISSTLNTVDIVWISLLHRIPIYLSSFGSCLFFLRRYCFVALNIVYYIAWDGIHLKSQQSVCIIC